MTWILITGLALGLLLWWAYEKSQRKTHPVSEGYQEDIVLPHESEFELYHNALSLCSMKSRLCMAELGIDYKSHHIDLIETGCYENIRSHFLKVNPAGTVPVLVHNGHPIYESHEQIRYAAQFRQDGIESLVPEDPTLLAEMESWVDRSSLTKDPIKNMDKSAGNAVPGQTVPLFCTMIEKIPYLRIFEGFLFHFDKLRPFLFTMLKLRGTQNLYKITPAAKMLSRSRKLLFVHLDALEEKLSSHGKPWIVGEQYTLADVSWLAIFERFRQADCEDVFLAKQDRPALHAYWARLQNRPAYKEAITDQSHPMIEYGRKRIAEAKESRPELRECLEGQL